MSPERQRVMYRHLRKFWYLYTIVSGILNVVMIYIVRLAKGMEYNWGGCDCKFVIWNNSRRDLLFGDDEVLFR